MKTFIEKVKNVNWKKAGTDALEISVGTVGFVGVGIVEGTLYVGKQTVQGSVDAAKTVKKLQEEFVSNEALDHYKEKVKGFTTKESK